MRKLVFLLTFLISCMAANAQPTQPILRIETGMHSAAATHIATDAVGKYLLTCSNDKTARSWDAATGNLLRTFRVPVGASHEGKIYSCALSPDGKTVALAGWTGYEWDHSCSVYIADMQTGEFITRITGIPSVITDIKFSPDGKWLAAGIAKDKGVYIYNTTTWNKYRQLDGYESNVTSLAFSKGGMLATTCADGKIRIYNNDLELIKQADGIAEKYPCTVSFASSGEKIAVAYEGIASVEIRSAKDLSLVYRPGTEKIPEDEFIYGICFSSNDKVLYGGGTFITKDKNNNDNCGLRIWQDAGQGKYADVPAMSNAIRDIIPLPNGNIAVAGAYPDIAVFSASGGRIWHQKAENTDYNGENKSHFRIDDEGNMIGFTPYEGIPSGFSVSGRSIFDAPATCTPPATTAQRTTLTNWQRGRSPAINGSKVSFFEDYDVCFSADVSDDGTMIVLGTEWSIYVCNYKGEKLWGIPLAGIAWNVNISGNGKVVAAALNDGTIRWYSIADGKELLSFYLHSDKQRWILFTPQGYYDAAPGAEDFLGWHINNGPDKAPSFYPLSRFRSKYYRPDIIDLILKTYDEDSAIAIANARAHSCYPAAPVEQRAVMDLLPPTVSVNSPQNLATVTDSNITIHYTVKNPKDATLKSMRVLVNGRPVPVRRGLNIRQAAAGDSLQITLQEGANKIALLAENANGFSPAATIDIQYKPGNNTITTKRKGDLYALVIGISAYNNSSYALNYAADDARGFVEVLRKQGGKQFDNVIVKELADKNATLSNIKQALNWIQTQTKQGDMAMIYYAGHGITENNRFYLLPADADVSNIYTCLNDSLLVNAVTNIAGKVVVFLDACHSGNAMSQCSRYTDVNAMINHLISNDNGLVVFTASTGREFAYEYPDIKHGAFTKALLEGFEGKAAPYSDDITVSTMDAYNKFRVKQLTNDKQHPTIVIPPNMADFNIGSK